MLSWLSAWVPRSRAVRHLLVLLLILLAAALGMVLHITERNNRQADHTTGSRAADRVHLDASVEEVRTGEGVLVLRIQVAMKGRLQGADGDAEVPDKNLRVGTSSLINGELFFPAGKLMDQREVEVDLDPPTETDLPFAGGSDSDYPLDRYGTAIGFIAELDGKYVPVSLTLRNVAALFRTEVVQSPPEEGVASFDITVKRSLSTFSLVVFMMLIMWGIALSVLNATWLVIGQRRGIAWPALSWMAFCMFALVTFRNAAPGEPPFGSLMDYASFLWAEVIIALCLMSAVFFGIRAERMNEAAEKKKLQVARPGA